MLRCPRNQLLVTPFSPEEPLPLLAMATEEKSLEKSTSPPVAAAAVAENKESSMTDSMKQESEGLHNLPNISPPLPGVDLTAITPPPPPPPGFSKIPPPVTEPKVSGNDQFTSSTTLPEAKPTKKRPWRPEDKKENPKKDSSVDSLGQTRDEVDKTDGGKYIADSEITVAQCGGSSEATTKNEREETKKKKKKKKKKTKQNDPEEEKATETHHSMQHYDDDDQHQYPRGDHHRDSRRHDNRDSYSSYHDHHYHDDRYHDHRYHDHRYHDHRYHGSYHDSYHYSGGGGYYQDDRRHHRGGQQRRRPRRPPIDPIIPGVSFNIIQCDLFEAPLTASLAHCVSEDMHMGKGIAVTFKEKFRRVGELLGQGIKTGGVAVLQDKERYIYYLVTKRRYFHRPTNETLKRSLEAMKDHITTHKVSELYMPLIGCGLDELEWSEVAWMIDELFKDIQLKITVCYI